VRTAIDAKANGYIRQIWLKDTESDAPAFAITAGPKDASPRWHPSGKWLGFVSGRGEKPQVMLLPIDQPGEARAMTNAKNGVSSFEFKPDGTQIAFASSLHAHDRAAEDSKEFKLPEGDPTDPRHITRVPMRSGTTYFDDKFRHVYLADVPTRWDGFEPSARRITDGDRSFGQPQWGAGGELFCTNHRDPESGDIFNGLDIVRLHADETRSYTRYNLPGLSVPQCKPSPDGQRLAVLVVREDGSAPRCVELCIQDIVDSAPTGTLRDLTSITDRNVGNFQWSANSQHLYFTLADGGHTNLHRIAVAGGAIEQLTNAEQSMLTNDESSAAFDVAADGRVVYTATTAASFNALFLRLPHGETRVLYAPNAAELARHVVCEHEPIAVDVDGRTIHGWIVKPPGFSSTGRYPLIVNIHGGPHVMWGPGFESMWLEHNAMAHAGYAVYYCNFRGSEGYGEAFWHADNGDWERGPMRDILAGMDAVLAHGYIDEKRLCVTGGSYGGYMVGMILAATRRFAAACAQRGVYNLLSIRNNSDIPYFFDRELGSVSPWQDPLFFWQNSPIAHVDKIDTPLLIEHSELDFRVPIEQAEQLYQALKLQRKTVELLRWPREGHELSRSGEPKHRVERIKRIIDWFDRYASQ
jgi:dipeptidyl aminopeptidase/acylaminoacyl peptidase